MGNASMRTPTRTPHSRSRSVLGEISLSGSRFNVPSPVPSEKYRATAAAANRLIDFNRRTPQTGDHKRSFSTATDPHDRRHLSKASRYRFLQRAASPVGESAGDRDEVTTPDTRLDLGNSQNPITHFRPHLWRHLDASRDTLNLDLFWPQRLDELEEQEDEDSEGKEGNANIFPLQGLLPLCGFRNLRSLRLSGMLQSYQIHIWRTCWLNPGLEELVLEMALEPTINELNRPWTRITGPWRQKAISEACTDYLGEQEDGSLSETAGVGEYLDRNAMASARSLVSSQGVNLRYLPIVKLVLAGFVVDAGPFFRWFNPMRLRQVEFKYGCVDAGFALPSHMSNLVTVSWPGKTQQDGQTITVSSIRPHDVSAIWLKRKPSTASQASGLKPKINSLLTKNWFSSARGNSLKARKSNKEHQQPASQAGRASSSSDLSLFRHRSSSGISWTSTDLVGLSHKQL